MVDLATLALKVDSTAVATGVAELDKLTAAGSRAEKSVDSIAGPATRTASALNGVTVSAGQQRAGMQQLSFQIGDVAQQFALGTKPMTIFAQQGGQVLQAITLMRGGAGGLIGFLGGPWGAVIMGAVTILGSLAAAHYAAADSSEAQKDAAEDLIDATNQLNDATRRASQSTWASIEADIAKAASLRARAQEARKAAVAELELAKARLNNANAAFPASAGQGVGGTAGAYIGGQASVAQADVSFYDKEIARQNATIAANNETIRISQGRMVGIKLNESYDKSAAAAGKFSRTQDKLNAGLGAGRITLEKYSTSLNAAIQTREHEEDAARKSSKTHRERKAAMTDEERAYQSASKAAESYIDNLEYEIQKIGKTPEQLRALEIARAKDAAATDLQRKKIEELGVAREAAIAKENAAKATIANADFERRTLQPLRDELALVGLTGAAREDAIKQQKLSALAAEEEAFKADALAKGLTGVNAKWLDYYMISKDLIERESVLERDTRLAKEFGEAMRDLQSIAGELDFSSAFGNAGSAINAMADSMNRLEAAQVAYGAAVKAAGTDQVKLSAAAALKRKAEVGETMALLSASKSLFRENSAGYKVMEAAERAYAAVQVISTIKSIAAGAAKIFSQLGVYAFPVVGAMIAVMAGLGFSGGSSAQAAPTSSQDRQDNAGTGSVLGDATAKSASIANSLEIMASNTNRDLEYSNQMLRALRSIDTNISALSGNIAQQISVSGSLFDTSGQRLGQSGSSGFLGLFASSTERSLYDLGVTLNSGSVADIIANGISGQTYQIIEQVKKKSGFLGIGGGTRTTYETTNGAIDASITAAIGDVIASLRNGLIEAAGVVGLEGAQALIDSFQVNIGTVSFAGMTGQEIEDQLNAIFSKVGDDMAGALFPALSTMQQIGEGLFETFIRVAREYQVVDTALKSIGMSFGAVGVASLQARDELVQLFGTLDDFASATTFFGENFLTEAERIAPVALSVREELDRLGLSGISTREQFKNAVLGIDLTTTAGRELYAALLAVAPAFDRVADYAEAANKKLTDAFSATIKEFEGYAASLTKYRDSLRQGELVGGNAYLASRRAFLSTADLAAQGDAGGLGGLENAGKTFLTASRANATSLTAYLRDVAMVANAVDQGIFAATETADYAQLQLDALNNSASILASIDAGIANVEVLLGGGQTPAIVTTSPVTGPPTGGELSGGPAIVELQAQISTNNALMLQMVENSSALVRLWSRYEGDGLLIRTDSDTPIQVETV